VAQPDLLTIAKDEEQMGTRVPGAEIVSVNPATEEVVARFNPHTPEDVAAAIDASEAAFRQWREISLAERGHALRDVARLLRQRVDTYAAVVTQEMGKPITQSRFEVDRCASQFEFYADHASDYLGVETVETSARDSYVLFEPLGPVLAVMPWNFPFSQVSRFAAPALMAGNTCLLKHASNVSQCALAIEEVFREADLPSGVFRTLLLPSPRVQSVIDDPRIRAVTVTGSSEAGAQIARAAGAALKKSVLELGGSDPFVVLSGADVARAASMAAKTRLSNTGQACACGKRFIVDSSVAVEFEQRFGEALAAYRVGDPMDPATQVGPLARGDLLETLEHQVQVSIEMGARVVVGGARRPGRGYFYQPTLLADCTPDMPVLSEETFGPVAALIAVADIDAAVRVANDTPYGLAATVWSEDIAMAKSVARRIDAGTVVINGIVASDPRMPFGGVKRSGYGRENGRFGIREFVNVKAMVVGGYA
jgi:succinate-semialdehyde dehydrogenase/glutarate-semialdehyde dehydrogenase